METNLCVFCAVIMVEKTVFGKTVYRCPKCGRQVKAEDAVQLPDIMEASEKLDATASMPPTPAA